MDYISNALLLTIAWCQKIKKLGFKEINKMSHPFNFLLNH